MENKQVPLDWIDRIISGMIAVCCVLAGAVATLMALLAVLA